MEKFKTLTDGKTPPNITKRYGRELATAERLENKVFGIGLFTILREKLDALTPQLELENTSVRPHIDQLTDGLIFRFTKTKPIDALVIAYTEILKIQLHKSPDIVDPIPFTPFWILIKLGFEPKNVRWFTRYGFQFGELRVIIEIENQQFIELLWHGRHEPTVQQFFRSKFLKEKLNKRQ